VMFDIEVDTYQQPSFGGTPALEIRARARVLPLTLTDLGEWSLDADRAGNVILAAKIRAAMRGDRIDAVNIVPARTLAGARRGDEAGLDATVDLLAKVLREIAKRTPAGGAMAKALDRLVGR